MRSGGTWCDEPFNAVEQQQEQWRNESHAERPPLVVGLFVLGRAGRGKNMLNSTRGPSGDYGLLRGDPPMSISGQFLDGRLIDDRAKVHRPHWSLALVIPRGSPTALVAPLVYLKCEGNAGW